MSVEEALALYWLVVAVAVLSVASVLWFFRARRRLIATLRDVTLALEKHYNPSNKEYQLLGYLVGYKARYILPGKHRVYVLLTTVPRHSLLYYPFMRLAGRRDRLEIAVSPHDRRVAGEIYLVKKGSRIDDAVLRNSAGERLGKLAVREVRGTYSYRVYCSDEALYTRLAEKIAKTKLPITMVAAFPDKNLLTASYELSPETLSDFLDFHDSLVREFTVPKTTKG